MNTNNTIIFKYFRPIIAIFFDIFTTIIYIFAGILSIRYLDFAVAIGFILVGFLVLIYLKYSVVNRLKDLKGKFIFRISTFDIETIFGKTNILYSDIETLYKEFYDDIISTPIANITQSNPGQFRIVLKNGKSYKFRNAKSEEKANKKELGSIIKRLFHLKQIDEKKNLNDKNEQLELEKAIRNYSLENAFVELSNHSSIKITDLTTK